MWRAAVMLVAAMAAIPATAAQNAATGELVNRDALRICANPSNLPFSNDKGEGFENKIAELLAAKLEKKLEYAWYPASLGFVRNTLRARRCDVIIGITGVHELVQNSNPYYRTAWTVVQRADDSRAIAGFDSSALAGMKIGVIAQTPPVTELAKRGLLGGIVSYRLHVDTRVENPSRQMLEDLAAGKIDAGYVYGPQGGYWQNRLQTPLKASVLRADNTRLSFRITMGIRHNEPLWKKKINDFLRGNKAAIEKILSDYGVPLLPI